MRRKAECYLSVFPANTSFHRRSVVLPIGFLTECLPLRSCRDESVMPVNRWTMESGQYPDALSRSSTERSIRQSTLKVCLAVTTGSLDWATVHSNIGT